MASNLIATNGLDFDNIFQQGQGNQLFYTYANNGQDVGQRYLPASEGDPAGNVGFLNSSGQDIGPKLCLTGTDGFYLTLDIANGNDPYGEIDYYFTLRGAILIPSHSMGPGSEPLSKKPPFGAISNRNFKGYQIDYLYDCHNNLRGTYLGFATIPWFNRVKIYSYATGREIIVSKVNPRYSLFRGTHKVTILGMENQTVKIKMTVLD